MVILSLFAALILFFVPTCLLGMIAPFANRLACHDANSIGRATGRLYALSTMGSIVGSLATTFLAVPYLGTRETIMIAATLLIILGLIGLGKWRYLPIILIPVVLYIGARSANIQNGKFNIRPRPGLVYEKESPYQFIQIVNDKEGLSLITNEGLSRHSMITKDSVWVNNIYDTFSILPAMMKRSGEKVSVLFLGLAGGTSSRQMNQLYGSKYQLTMTGVDIDSAMVEAGIKYLDMPIDKVEVHYMDARQYLRGTDKKYDLIILDAFAQQYDVPYHLLTQEFFRSVNDRLEPDGVFSMNVISVERHSQMNDSVTQTLGSVFSDVRITAVPKSRNYLIVAGHDTMSLHPEWVAGGHYPPITLAAVSQFETATSTKAKIFTDNWAPVEYLTEHAYLEANL